MVEAREFRVAVIEPYGFIIEIVDENLKPISGYGFAVNIDGIGLSMETDNNGIMKLPKPKNEIKLSLPSMEDDASPEKSKGNGETSEVSGSNDEAKATPSSEVQEETEAVPATEETQSPKDEKSESSVDKEKSLSGKSWTNEFPGSKSLDDLEPKFKSSAKKFIDALEKAGAKVDINATKRPKERAYLMHHSWKIVNQDDYDASKIPPLNGVNINWWHGDIEKSKTAAKEMVDGFGLNNLKTPPALDSRHIECDAIDMNISWKDNLRIKKDDGSDVIISTTPRDGTNAQLIEVGASYGVIHFKNVNKDKVHWSIDGR
jgi:hypothetical protein